MSDEGLIGIRIYCGINGSRAGANTERRAGMFHAISRSKVVNRIPQIGHDYSFKAENKLIFYSMNIVNNKTHLKQL